MTSPATCFVAIDTVRIGQDKDGRFNLNDLHRAAMAAGKATKSQRPAQFLRADSVLAFVQTLTDAQKSASVVTIRGGKRQGTYAVELVAIRYAGWLDPIFEVQVYQTFQAVRRGEIEEARHIASRERARLEAPFLASALKNAREDAGKSVSPHVFINEHNIIYGIVLGCSAKLYRDRRKLPKNANIRDHVKDDELVAIAHLQHIDAGLVEAGLDTKERQKRLYEIYQRHRALRLAGGAA